MSSGSGRRSRSRSRLRAVGYEEADLAVKEDPDNFDVHEAQRYAWYKLLFDFFTTEQIKRLKFCQVLNALIKRVAELPEITMCWWLVILISVVCELNFLIFVKSAWMNYSSWLKIIKSKYVFGQVWSWLERQQRFGVGWVGP